MAKQENSPTIIGLTQYLDPGYWSWTDAEKQVLATGDAGEIGEVVTRRLEADGREVESVYAIVHDKDEREV
nr:hypothetical protein [Brevibacterium jeotgali]